MSEPIQDIDCLTEKEIRMYWGIYVGCGEMTIAGHRQDDVFGEDDNTTKVSFSIKNQAHRELFTILCKLVDERKRVEEEFVSGRCSSIEIKIKFQIGEYIYEAKGYEGYLITVKRGDKIINRYTLTLPSRS